jgi:hypothetical protein
MPYLSSSQIDPLTLSSLALGIPVERASAILPATTSTTYFTVAGGRVACYFLGEVTVVFDGTANSLNLTHTPTGGTVGDICAAAVCTSKEVGTMFGMSGLPTDALTMTTSSSLFRNRVILKPGAVKLKTTGTDTTGSTKWTCWYLPIDAGATVVAA